MLSLFGANLILSQLSKKQLKLGTTQILDFSILLFILLILSIAIKNLAMPCLQ